VGHCDGGASPAQPLQGQLHQPLALVVQRRGGLVTQQHLQGPVDHSAFQNAAQCLCSQQRRQVGCRSRLWPIFHITRFACHLGILQDSACDGNTLLLATAELDALLSHLGFVPVAKRKSLLWCRSDRSREICMLHRKHFFGINMWKYSCMHCRQSVSKGKDAQALFPKTRDMAADWQITHEASA